MATETAISALSSPQEKLLLRLLSTADNLHRMFQQRLRPFGLTPTQYNVLRILRAASGPGLTGLTCSAIGRSMVTPVPDITRLLARMKAQHLIRQQRDKTDRRVVWTFITKNGLDLLATLDATMERAPRELFRALDCQQVNQLSLLLEQVMGGHGCPMGSPTHSKGALPAHLTGPISAAKRPGTIPPRPTE